MYLYNFEDSDSCRSKNFFKRYGHNLHPSFSVMDEKTGNFLESFKCRHDLYKSKAIHEN